LAVSQSASNRVARVYAKALMDVGVKNGNLPEIYDCLMALAKVYDDDREFRAFFTSPRLDGDLKFRIIQEAVGEKLVKPVLGLVYVMIKKGREALLDNVAGQFMRLKDIAEGKLHVYVTTARPLGDEQKAEIQSLIAKRSGKVVELHERIDESLIGGTIVRVEDYVIDGSLRRRLSALRKRLITQEGIFQKPASA